MSRGQWGLADITGVKGIHRYQQESEDIEAGSRNQVDIMDIGDIKEDVWCHGAYINRLSLFKPSYAQACFVYFSACETSCVNSWLELLGQEPTMTEISNMHHFISWH